MKSYLFSIFTRFYLAFSGFLVFVITAILFGSMGRGVIGFGTSLFAIAGLTVSLNLGRSFLDLTRQSEKNKRQWLKPFLIINLGLGLTASCGGLVFYFLSSAAQQLLSLKQVLWFSLTSFFYVWSLNGNALFASFLKTRQQERILFFFRSALIVLVASFYFFHHSHLDHFIAAYSFLLFLGTGTEIFLLMKMTSSLSLKAESYKLEPILKSSLVHHVDFLSFQLYPLILTVLLASYASLEDVGRFNFTLQIVNLIFLFPATAHIRITTYVADVGLHFRIEQTKKLLLATALICTAAVVAAFFALRFATRWALLDGFQGVEQLFLISAIGSLPGYILYQFLSPFWVELQLQRRAAFLSGVHFLVFILLAPFLLANWEIQGAAVLFALFHVGVAFIQLSLFLRARLGRGEGVTRKALRN